MDARKISDKVFDLAQKHGLESAYLAWAMEKSFHLAESPLERLPCANVKPAEEWRCDKDGKMTCGECKLVSYCSKDCQRSHWRSHKQDCKDPIRSPDWQPAWIRELRSPSFMSNSPTWVIPQNERQFALDLHIWGNIPAMDTLNLANNEGSLVTQSNLALAYVASGDLRNVVRTVNELPSDFSGELTVLLNDREPMIVLRNILLLMILGTVEDVTEAADIAIHFWSSAFVQAPHLATHSRVILEFAQALQEDDSFFVNLGNDSNIGGIISSSTKNLLYNLSILEMKMEDANRELHRVRFEPTRQDRHHRTYCRLQPSHRLAFLEYRRFGIVLPFGAANNNFNTPNKFLFSPDGQWLQDDMASPLESWNIEDVVAAGKAHGAQPADIYGCLYFYLSEQFRIFADRLRKFKISFKIYTVDARQLAKNLGDGIYESQGLTKDTVFDRIDVSNIIDTEYVGIPNVLADWAPFLNKNNKCAAILGYSMNWVPKQYNSEPGNAARVSITPKLINMGRIGVGKNFHPDLIPAWFKYYVALYDNSAAFEEYLKKQGTNEASRRAGVKRRSKHTVVPHRIGARIGDSPNALPNFPTDDSWYWNVQVCQAMLSERFVEFCRV
ncbi:hypothetical protein CPB84DRAFT_1368633 [Gymnopilus junonius]|uniref:MYND-type domain-containing protein n=1 Tax=Gymnopilus junonius TaxID=109634 RepID=A0A9P5TLA1_GYMJU|nr:hypothetical protein CPB84DRAFT_1368633 [Gymnopilus junonius]